MTDPRPFTMVTFKDDCKQIAQNFYPHLLEAEPLLYIGEILNMPGHGVFVAHQTGKIYSGYHIDSFRELTKDEV